MGTSGSRRADPGAKRGKYVLAFVDDGDNTHEVDARDVVNVRTFHCRKRVWANLIVSSLNAAELLNCFVSDHLGHHVTRIYIAQRGVTEAGSFDGHMVQSITLSHSRLLCPSRLLPLLTILT